MSWYSHIVASVYDPFLEGLEREIGPVRKQMLDQTSGTVLEVGSGTGVNFNYYPEDVKVIAIEPNKAMYKKSIKKNPPEHIKVINAGLESDEVIRYMPEEGYDFIVSMLVLCSVKDYPAAVERYHRLLKKDGRLLVLEHIHSSGSFYGKFQKWVNPVWKVLSEGCHLTRRQDLDLKKFFKPLEEEYFRLGTDWYRAVMVKKD